jgi:hypothetical protein
MPDARRAGRPDDCGDVRDDNPSLIKVGTTFSALAKTMVIRRRGSDSAT